MSEPTRVIFGIDFSEMTDAVISTALRAGAACESAELHAVSVLSTDGSPLAAKAASDEIAKLEAALRARIADCADISADAVTCHVCVGSVGFEIAALAESLRAELIVIGRHGHGRSRPVIVGSVPLKLLQLAHCSVLVVQPPSYK